MFVLLRQHSCKPTCNIIRYGISSIQCSIHYSTYSKSNPSDQVPVGAIVNDQLFDKLVRKPYERQQYHPKFISNMKFTEIIIKHGLIDSSIILCSTLGVCALCSQFGWLSPSLIQSFSDSSFFLNKLFPFLQSISSIPMKNTFELWTLISPVWILSSVAVSWLGCRRELNKLYDKYEKENEEMLIEEKPGFIQNCSLEDGCSMRFYGDECQHGNNRKFTKKSEKSSFYDGYGGDCSFKASNVK